MEVHMSQLQGWLNTSKDKLTVWVKPYDGELLAESIFVNVESKDALRELVETLRAAYEANTSYELTLDIEEIERSRKGSAKIEVTLDEVLDRMVEVKPREEAKVSETAAKKAADIRAELAKRPRRTTTATSDDDEFVI